MQSTATPLDAGMDVAASRQRLQEMGRNVALVGELNWLHGIVNARQLEEVENPAETKLSQVVNGDGSYPYVHPDHPLSLALERMGAAGADALPVVSRANRRRVEGVITMADVLVVYGVKLQEGSKQVT